MSEIIDLPNIKKLILPDPGYEIADADYSGADAMIVAYDSQCKWLIDFFASPKGKLYAYIASIHLQREITSESPEYKPYKAVCHGCVTGDHEVLTRKGWVKISEYNWHLQELAVWSIEDSTIKFELPKSFNRDYVYSTEPLYKIEGDSYSQLTTLDHKFPYWSNGTFKKTEAKDLIKSARLPYTGAYVGGNKEASTAYMQLVAALQAEGHVKYIGKAGFSTYEFRFVKERKVQRLKNILDILHIPYTEEIRDKSSTGNEITSIRFVGFLEEWMKQLDWWILDYTKEAISAWAEELFYWDGCITGKTGRRCVSTTDEKSSVIMQTVFQLLGYGSKRLTKLRDTTRKTLYEVSINNRKFYRKETGVAETVNHSGTTVYCPQTSTGFFMVRYKGHIMVTGNTNYGLGVDKLARMLGIPVSSAIELQEFYFHLCPEIKLWHIRIQKEIASQGYIENIFGRRGWFLNKNDVTLFNKAYAFIPQSTIADLINHGIVNVYEQYNWIQVLMQVHDSGVFQYPIPRAEEARKRIIECLTIELPYDPPLIIPADIKVSTVSYGDCKKLH
jgi:hypothetical protein